MSVVSEFVLAPRTLVIVSTKMLKYIPKGPCQYETSLIFTIANLRVYQTEPMMQGYKFILLKNELEC